MDKINSADWNDIFGRSEQQLVFASERYTDLRFHFEETGLVSGFTQSISTPGMRLTEFFLNASRPFQLAEKEATETAESVFVLDGVSESHFHNLSSPLSFNKNYHNFQYNQQFGGEHIFNSPVFHALTIIYDLPFLKQLVENDDNNSSVGQLANSVHKQKTYIAASKALPCHGRLAEVIGSIRQCPFSGVTRYLFLESKMMELFVLQMQQAQSISGSMDHYWSAIDKEKLHAVKNYIETAYLEAFSLEDLTYKFSLNEFKLKKGYKQLFQTTVFGHVHQLRMQKAKTLLEKKTMNVSEAAFFIGYDNVSSFCVAFKKRFGCSPGKIVC